MNQPALVSIVINNYNYGRFLEAAIDSALNQTYPETEVVVVDDGSTDNSRTIISTYEEKVTPVLKANGGQASAFNAGFTASRGQIILFLDADDMLLPTAAEQVVEYFDDPDIVKVHWRLRVIDERGRETGELRPDAPLPQGDRREAALAFGPTNHLSAPTSGNAWSRSYLQHIFPVPDLFRTGADTYLFELAPFFGVIRTISHPLSLYRKHGSNFHASMTLDYKLQRQLKYYERCCTALSRHFRQQGVEIDPQVWKRYSWWHRLDRAVQEISALSSSKSPFILVDDATWEVGPIGGRRRIPFLERNGYYWGCPPDDETAIDEFDRVRRQTGARHIIFAWPTFWWLDYYTDFCSYLRSNFSSVLENERLLAFDLPPPQTLQT